MSLNNGSPSCDITQRDAADEYKRSLTARQVEDKRALAGEEGADITKRGAMDSR